MLKNLSPLLSGALLTALDDMHEGQLLTLTSGGEPEFEPTPGGLVIDLGDVAAERAAEAILSVFPLDGSGAPPIAFLNDGEGELPDIAYALCGLAADAELRRIDIAPMPSAPFAELAGRAAVTVRADPTAPAAAFVLRRGAC